MQAQAEHQELKSLLLALTQQQERVAHQQAAVITRLSALETNTSALRIEVSELTDRTHGGESGSSAESHDHDTKRHRSEYVSGLPVLERDEMLLKILQHAGTADWLYIASINRRWRGLYYSLCHKARKNSNQLVMRTGWRAAVVTASRLQYAFEHGLSAENINKNLRVFAKAVGECSLEPVAVMTLARVRGVSWHATFCDDPALKGDWSYLRWLRSSGCLWDVRWVYECATDGGHNKNTMSILPWIKQQTSVPLEGDIPMDAHDLQDLMWETGCNCPADYVEWVHTELQAPWPDQFFDGMECWPGESVKVALKHGSGWGIWQCQKLLRSWLCKRHKDNAQALFEWTHKGEGKHKYKCPCTCETQAS